MASSGGGSRCRVSKYKKCIYQNEVFIKSNRMVIVLDPKDIRDKCYRGFKKFPYYFLNIVLMWSRDQIPNNEMLKI